MWYAFIESNTGKLISLADELNDALPKGIEVVELGDDFDPNEDDISKVWNPNTKTYEDKVFPQIKTKQEKLDDIALDLKLTPEQKEALEKYL